MSMPTLALTLDGSPIAGITISGASISIGRQTIDEQPAPTAMSLTVLTPEAPWPFKVGATIELTATANGVTTTRFSGSITDVRAGRYTTQLVATSSGLGRLARLTLPPTPLLFIYPGMAISELITVANTYAGSNPVTMGDIDTGQVETIAGLSQEGNALAACQQVATWEPFGILWETGSGVVNFWDSERRQDLTPAFTLVDDHLIADWQAVQSLSSLTNVATITYGSPTETVSAINTGSVAEFGAFAKSESIPLESSTAATTRANRIVANGSQPSYITQPIGIQLASDAFTTSQTASVLALEVNDVLAYTGGTVPGVAPLMFIEGWTETIGSKSYSIDYYLSDCRLTRPPQQWQDIAGTVKWSDVGATITWDDLILEYI